MFAGERKPSRLVMIEVPVQPAACVVAVPATGRCAQRTRVVGIRVTVLTRRSFGGEAFVRMAGSAGKFAMFAEQRKMAEVVIETHLLLPGFTVVATRTILSQPAKVGIVFCVAGATLG